MGKLSPGGGTPESQSQNLQLRLVQLMGPQPEPRFHAPGNMGHCGPRKVLARE